MAGGQGREEAAYFSRVDHNLALPAIVVTLQSPHSPSAAKYQKAEVLGLCRDCSISVENTNSAPKASIAQRGFVNRQDQAQQGLCPLQPAGWDSGSSLPFPWPELRRFPPLLLLLLPHGVPSWRAWANKILTPQLSA